MIQSNAFDLTSHQACADHAHLCVQSRPLDDCKPMTFAPAAGTTGTPSKSSAAKTSTPVPPTRINPTGGRGGESEGGSGEAGGDLETEAMLDLLAEEILSVNNRIRGSGGPAGEGGVLGGRGRDAGAESMKRGKGAV